MKLQKVLSLICVFAIASVMFTGCSNDKNTIEKNSFDTEAVSSIIGDVFVTENDNFKLEINEVTKGIILTDKNTGKVYGTNPIEEGGIKYDELGMPIKRHPQLESVLFIKYLDTQKNTTTDMISYTAAVSKGRTTVEMVDDGVKINYYFDDARKSIKLLNNTYDIVFLDAFSSQKDPTLWTIDFLSEVKLKMNENSVLVSYSKSTPFRSALVELGFYVGKTFIDEQDMGTIASLNKNNILNPLTNYDFELLSTRSGITFKDSELNLSGDKILLNREIEQKTSSRISHTAFLKKYSN